MDNNTAHRENIRKLAKNDEIKGGLGSQQEREPILGKLTPFDNSAFAPDSNAGAGTDGGLDPDDPNSMAEPDPSDPSNANNDNSGGGGNRDPDKNGPQDADDLIDDTKGPTLPDDIAGDPFSGGSLNKITGLEDCETGQCVTMHLDGNFPAPDGWDGPDSPPPVDGWVQGVRWAKTGSPSLDPGAIPEDVVDNIIAYLAGLGHTNVALVSLTQQTSFSYQSIVAYNHVTTSALTHFISQINSQSCTPTSGSVDCPIDAPGPTEWPLDGCYDVAMIDGKVVTNDYDSEAPASAQEERSSAKFCTTGGKEVVIRAAANGKTMMYPVTAGGAPTGIVKVYNSDGTLSSAGDASQQNIDSQLPR